MGAAQSFTVLNFVQRNSFGQGTDTLNQLHKIQPLLQVSPTIFTQDFWGYQGSGGGGAAIYQYVKCWY